MRLQSLAFAGYRSFAARSPRALQRPLEELRLAPLTVLLGKNNSGKSTTARLLHHVLLALSGGEATPFPMRDERRTYGLQFRDVQHNGNFFAPLDLDLRIRAEDGVETSLVAQLNQISDSADDVPPVMQVWKLDGNDLLGTPCVRGLLPDVPSTATLRQEAKRLLDASCYLGPLRDPVKSTYTIGSPASDLKPDSNSAIAQMLLANPTLRTSVGEWMAQNIDGWSVDVQQTLSAVKLIARRHKRESNLADAGQGLQQVLPVVTLCRWRSLGLGEAPFLDVIEQPELHMHDAAHAALGDLLLSAVSTERGNVVVETHSESLVLRLRRRIAEGLSPHQVALIYVEDTEEGSRLKPISISEDGEVNWWPEGVFSEAFLEVKAIRRAQRQHERSAS